MIKQSAVKLIIYYVFFALLALSERALGVTGFCVGFLFSLVYCREKVWCTVPAFVGALLSVSFSLLSGITVAAGGVIAIAVTLIHYKKKFKYTLVETSLLTLAAMIPTMAMSQADPFSVAITALSVGLAEVFHYVGVLGLYPILVRGLRFRLGGNEKVALAATVCILAIGLGIFRPFKVGVFHFVFAFCIVFLRGIDRNIIIPFGISAGLGAAIGEGNADLLAYFAVMSLVCFALSRQKSPIAAAGAAVSFVAATYFFNGEIDLWTVVPLAVGCLAGACFPEKFFEKVLSSRQGYRERFALRTVVNRDREELAERLKSVAAAFSDMQAVLQGEKQFDDSPAYILKEVLEGSCVDCPRFRQCDEKIDITQSVGRLVAAALDNGKASLLDASVGLGENCFRLSHLLNLSNDSVKTFRRKQEQRSGIEQGREMVIAQLSGMAAILNSLARSVAVNMTFDPEPERKLIEKLGQANVIATDVCLYTDDGEPEITAVVRESDADKECLAAIISETMGCPMAEFGRKKDVKNTVCLHFCRAPAYKVLFGATVSSKESRCGDTRQAVKIGYNKLMFILSDGMGTGSDAFDTAGNVIRLIETFYRAGFDHRTVFSNVAKLISLREKEDFSALDVAIIDTQTGEIDFIKQGGRESYIFSGNDYEIIDGGSLPMGIIADSEPIIERRRLKCDDLVIMMSDGVADAVETGKIAQIIRNTPCQNPQNASDALVKDALRLAGSGTDDMTVIALRLVRAER